MRPYDDLAWRIGGPQGSGVDTAAVLFARACALGGLHVFGRREYYSNIMGRHSYYDVRVAHHALTCHRDSVHLLTTFDAETLVRHGLAVVDRGGILYDSHDADIPLSRITFLDARLQDDVHAYLDDHDLPASTAGLLDGARSRGVQTFEVSYDAITRMLAEELEVPQATADRTRNTVAVALSCALLAYEPIKTKQKK